MDEYGIDHIGEGYRSTDSTDNYGTCNGVCAMGAIHVDMGRTYSRIHSQYEIIGKLRTQKEQERLGQAVTNPVTDVEYGMLMRSWLYAAADVAANTIWHRWAAQERTAGNPVLAKHDEYGNYRHEIRPESALPYYEGIISWNDDPQTTEEDLRDFFTVLSDHAEYRQARILCDLQDDELGRRYAKQFFNWRNEEEITYAPEGHQLLIYKTLKGANVI